MLEYDVCVIGGGSAGLTVAYTTMTAGKKTVLIEKDKVGGECTHSGCIPSKALISIAKRYDGLKSISEMMSEDALIPEVDSIKVMQQVRKVIEDVYKNESPDKLQADGIDVLMGEATFVGPDKIKVGEDTIKFKNAVICTGSSPFVPPIEGLDDIEYLTNQNFFQLKELPKSILFVGGGPISVELSQSLHRIGIDATIIEMLDRIIPTEDRDVSVFVKGKLEMEGVKVITDARVKKFVRENKRIKVTYDYEESEEEIICDSVFISTGRKPNLEGLALEKAGVKYNKKGIVVDEYLRTSNLNIYGAGDVVGPYQFTNTAGYQGLIASSNILNEEMSVCDLSVIPWTIFFDPEVSHVGLTQEQSDGKYDNVVAYKSSAHADRMVTDRVGEGIIKVVFDEHDNILGVHAAAPMSGEFIHEIALAMKACLKPGDIVDLIHVYPSYSEIVKNLMNSYINRKK